MAYSSGKKPMMANMTAYNKGYEPPEGSAGGEAFGAYSTKTNPRPVPKKGSSIPAGSDYGMNADRAKVMRMKNEQASRERLRGVGC